jgi:hypothetical protein
LKNTVYTMTLPLSILFERSMTCNYIPDVWKTAKITPLHKKGSTTSCSNYRPISLTSTICKVMERIIVNQMQSFLHSHNLTTSAQYGFQKKAPQLFNLSNVIRT